MSAAASGVFVSTGGWYEALQKPSWNPPSWLFGPVWTTLYVLMGIAAWLVWREGGWKVQGRPLRWFLVQWFLDAIWIPLFFGLHLPLLAFGEIVLLWFAIAVTARVFWRVKVMAGALLIPYLAWVSFAAILNFTIASLNRAP